MTPLLDWIQKLIFRQAIKLLDFLYFLASSDNSLRLCGKWLVVDFTYLVILSCLRIPRLNYSFSVIILQILFLWLFNGLMFGGIHLNIGGGPAGHDSRVESAFQNLSRLNLFSVSQVAEMDVGN
jgi:hypothetical protein